MTIINNLKHSSLRKYFHIDHMLFFFVVLLAATGLFILYSASNQNIRVVEFQLLHYFLLAFTIMVIFAQISPYTLKRSAPWLYATCLIMLIAVLLIGHIGKGGQRWLNIGIIRFQPAELMKLTIPLLLAWYYHKIHLPIRMKSVLITIPIILFPPCSLQTTGSSALPSC